MTKRKGTDGWLKATDAAKYVGVSRQRLHQLAHGWTSHEGYTYPPLPIRYKETKGQGAKGKIYWYWRDDLTAYRKPRRKTAAS